MKLIVGLGNIGKTYENTRHNIGFMVLDSYLDKNNLKYSKEKFNGLYCDAVINGEKVIFLKPLLFMNNSGIVIKKYMDYFNIDIDDILIVYDDLDLDVGDLKLKLFGGTAGHNGLKSIEENLKSSKYKRLKIGISRNNINKADYVLGKFSKEDKNIINDVLKVTDILVSDYFKITFENLMNKYN